MEHQRSGLFLHVKSEPNANANPRLWTHRLRQRRPVFGNPFESDSAPSTGYGLAGIDSPGVIQNRSFELDQDQPNDQANRGSQDELTRRRKNPDMEWGEQVPNWLNLFFDLAWTATFSSLTSNNKFRNPWDSGSYAAFFTAAWWLWVSQVSYNVEFYTDDWFHLFFIFLQLVVFGGLAATTQGFDVTNYILRSPGTTQLEAYNEATATPERYSAERLTKISLRVIMFVLAISRVLLLIQHLRVVIYAKLTSKSGRVPRQLLVVPASLVVSAALFFGAFEITRSPFGREPYGAKVKFILSGAALLVEAVAHYTRFRMDIGHGLRLRSHGSVTGRLNDITTIILGEGINAIAGTFYAVEQAPGFSKPIGTAIICCGIIVFFLVYLYFEGAAPLETVRRRAAWMMMHLPWLLSVILLLEGVKDQLLLSGFLTSAVHLMNTVGTSWTAEGTINATMRPVLLQAGVLPDQELGKLFNTFNAIDEKNLTQEAYEAAINEAGGLWYLRVQMSGVLSTYKTFMNNESIPEATYGKFQQYLTNDTFTLEDLATPGDDLPHFWDVINELVKPSADNARYIMAICGITFICLASLNLIQSWPRDRFHWASIFSRYAMGICMLSLLFLNFGKYKQLILLSTQDPSKQSGVYRWIDSGMVLPTLAIAYGVQFFVDTGLVWLAVRCGNKQEIKDVVRTEESEEM